MNKFKILVVFLTIVSLLSCNSERRLSQRKLIVNFKDESEITKSLQAYNYELLYFSKDSLELYKKNNISKASFYTNDKDLFYKEIFTTLTDWKKELNHSVVILAKSKRKRKKIKNSLENDPNILFVQENELQKLNYYPNDPYYSSLWGVSKINCSPAWDLTEGNDIVIAVIDDGTALNHNDIKGNLWTGPFGEYGYDLTNSGNLNPNAGAFHGTHVDGTISALGNNNLGVIGVAPKAKILTIKVFPNADDIRCATAFEFAMERNAKIINNSWGPTHRRPTNPELSRVIDIANRKNINVVFAAGNDNDDVQYYAPANHPRVIAVAATDEIDKRCSFSNFGNQISVAAPGQNILSLNANNGISSLSGTSMAAPHVSGLIALLLKINPKLTPEQIKLLIENNTSQIQTDKPLGFGRINVYNTVYQTIITQRHNLKLTFTGVLTDHDDLSDNEICPFNIPFELSLLPDGQINTGEIATERCDNEVWAKIFYSCSLDFNKTLEFTGTIILYDADNLQGSQTFNVRLPYRRIGNIISGDVSDEDAEDQVAYKIGVTSFD